MNMRVEDIRKLTADDGWSVELKIEHGDGMAYCYLDPEDGRWVEGRAEGDRPYGWGGKRYMGYLSVAEVLGWLKSDYDYVEIVDVH